MSAANARNFLALAAQEPERVRRHLLMAAALGELLARAPVVVGGTAEEYWTQDEYRPTDLDLCGPMDDRDRRALARAGFRRDGRHWYHPVVPTVAIEFPDSRLDGDPARVHIEHLEGGAARVIGLDDLYLDRLRQATISPSQSTREFASAQAVVAARYEELDVAYVRARLTEIARTEPQTAKEMRRIDRLLQARARRALTDTGLDRPRVRS